MVVDTSVILAVLLNEPEKDAIRRATRGAVVRAPGSILWEVGNALVAAFRRHRLSASQVEAAWDAFSAVPLRLIEVSVESALRLAMLHDLYAYDGYLLAAAVQTRTPLLTLDRRLSDAAARTGVPTLEVTE